MKFRQSGGHNLKIVVTGGGTTQKMDDSGSGDMHTGESQTQGRRVGILKIPKREKTNFVVAAAVETMLS